jgi:hypothetical protein
MSTQLAAVLTDAWRVMRRSGNGHGDGALLDAGR